MQMYKKHFAAWGLRKNTSARQKEEVLRCCKENIAPRNPASVPTNNIKPISEQKIRRYIRSQRKRDLPFCGIDKPLATEPFLAPTSGNILLATSITQRPRLGSFSEQSDRATRNREKVSPALSPWTVFLSQSTESLSIEAFLHSVRNYYDLRLQQVDFSMGFTRPVSEFVHDLDIAGAHLTINNQRAFALLQRACESFHLVVQEPCDFLLNLMRILAAEHWNSHLAAKMEVLRFMTKMALQKLGVSHALTSVLQSLTREGATNVPIALLAQLVLDTASRCLCEQKADFHFISAVVVKILKAEDILDAVEGLCFGLRSSEGGSFSESHEVRRETAFLLGKIYWKQYSDDEAMLILHDIVKNEAGNLDYLWRDACYCLAKLYEDHGDSEQSEKYFRMSFEGMMQAYGAYSVHSLRRLLRLLQVLDHQGKDEKARHLRAKYGYIWEYWGSYTVTLTHS